MNCTAPRHVFSYFFALVGQRAAACRLLEPSLGAQICAGGVWPLKGGLSTRTLGRR